MITHPGGIVEYDPEDAPHEGDKTGWHIRLRRKCGEIESWQVWRGDHPKSSLTTKDYALKWAQEGNG